jgi:ATP-dependent DNA helicase RecQ
MTFESPSTNTLEQTALTGVVAKHAVIEYLRKPIGTPPDLEDKLVVRLLRGIQIGDNNASEADRAVLVRQILGNIYANEDNQETVVPDDDGWPDLADWKQYGVTARSVRDGIAVVAQPWIPDWIDSANSIGVDNAAVVAAVRNQTRSVDGDPFLAGLGVSRYRSDAQRTAVRSALKAPPASTLLVTLPTGEGKSLVYLSVARYGYEDSPGPDGVTLVVVPTIALAVDQKQAAVEHGLIDKPRAFLGGDPDSTNNQIIESIKNGTQGLVFAAPESVSGRLRSPLEDAASKGHFKALVIDEAHLISTWGANFRPEFQVLSGLRRSLIAASPMGKEPRTILLSATVTQSAFESIKTLFTDTSDDSTTKNEFATISGARIRPEIDYWSAEPSSEPVRIDRVEEALRHLPRPAILYTSRVDDADDWFIRAKAAGFRRVARMTGHTTSRERDEIIRGWRNGTIDLVVGTSAFGLGIDNQHVRSVIHACIPESLDRFYQEVGRSGRDGRAAISLVVPSFTDTQVAEHLANSPLISVNVGFGRWQAMYHHPDRTVKDGHRVHEIRVDVPPGDGIDRMDMVGDQNTAWNQRTLAMLANTGLIELKDFRSEAIEESQPDGELSAHRVQTGNRDTGLSEYAHFQTIFIADPQVNEIDTWHKQVETFRKNHSSTFRRGLQAMNDVLSGTVCTSSVLAPMYRISTNIDSEEFEVRPSSACGGCKYCRKEGLSPLFKNPGATSYPWKYVEKQSRTIDDIVDKNRRAIVFTPPNMANSGRAARRFHSAVTALAASGVRSWTIQSGYPLDSDVIQASLSWPIIFISPHESKSLPPGPSLFMGLENSIESTKVFDTDISTKPRLYFLPENTRHPERRDRALKNNVPIRWISLDSFIAKGMS